MPTWSAGVSPASRWPKTGTRRRDASAPRKCAPVQDPEARPKLEVEAPQACALGVKGSVFDENRQQNECPNNVQPFVPGQPEMAARNGNTLIAVEINRGRNSRGPGASVTPSQCRRRRCDCGCSRNLRLDLVPRHPRMRVSFNATLRTKSSTNTGFS